MSAPKYKPPVPDLGPVLWYHVPGGEPSPAIVTRAGRDACDVIVFPPESRVGVPKSGVLYVNDPRAKTMVSPESGFWDYTEDTKLIHQIKRELLSGADKTLTVEK
jgi:hypothetical protein